MVFGLFTFLGAFLSYIWPALWIASCVTTRMGIHVGVNSVSGGDLVHSQVIPIGIWCSTLSLRPVMFHIMVALEITFNYEAARFSPARRDAFRAQVSGIPSSCCGRYRFGAQVHSIAKFVGSLQWAIGLLYKCLVRGNSGGLGREHAFWSYGLDLFGRHTLGLSRGGSCSR